MQENPVTSAGRDKCAQCQKDFNPEYGGFDKYVLHSEEFPGISAKQYPLFEENLCIDCWQDALYGEKNLWEHSLQNKNQKRVSRLKTRE